MKSESIFQGFKAMAVLSRREKEEFALDFSFPGIALAKRRC